MWNNLLRKVRIEISERRETVSKDPKIIFAALSKVFGDGDSLPMLQEIFFSYNQLDSEEIHCFSELIDLFDGIAAFNQIF